MTTAADEGFLEELADGTKIYLERVAERIGSAGSSLVFGQPVQQDGVTVIPVATVKWGFGGGIGLDEPAPPKKDGASPTRLSLGTGGGGGVLVTPAGYIELAHGRARYHPIRHRAGLLSVAVVGAVIATVINISGLIRSRRGRTVGKRLVWRWPRLPWAAA